MRYALSDTTWGGFLALIAHGCGISAGFDENRVQQGLTEEEYSDCLTFQKQDADH
jgi:hypothetical protein